MGGESIRYMYYDIESHFIMFSRKKGVLTTFSRAKIDLQAPSFSRLDV